MKSLCYMLLIGLCLGLSCKDKPLSTPFPNIIYILADDLGYGDVTAFNPQSKIPTPHLDVMAQKGRIFTDAHSGSAVCSPTRYGILTGRYAWRSTLKSGVTWSWSPPLIPPTRTTVASLLKRHGYHTACIGKWHLGLDWQKDSLGQIDLLAPVQNGPLVNGFDVFFGITASLDIPPYVYLEQDRATATTIDTIEARAGKAFWRRSPIGNDFVMDSVLPTFARRAVDYIHQRAGESQPFFLYLPLPAPHTPILPTQPFQGKSGTNEYGDFVMMVDHVLGQVMEALAADGLEENTLVIFTSDNGCSPMADFGELAQFDHHPSGPYRGHKADIFEGGHRVPFLAQWPVQIPAGTSSAETICLTDLLATTAALTGDTLAASEGEDSYNLLPLLLGESPAEPLREATVHHSINGSFAIRQGKWKLIFCPGSGGWSEPRPAAAREQALPPLQLYDLSQDVAESHNLVEAEAEVVARLTALMEQYIQRGRSTPGSIQQNEGETGLYKMLE